MVRFGCIFCSWNVYTSGIKTRKIFFAYVLTPKTFILQGLKQGRFISPIVFALEAFILPIQGLKQGRFVSLIFLLSKHILPIQGLQQGRFISLIFLLSKHLDLRYKECSFHLLSLPSKRLYFKLIRRRNNKRKSVFKDVLKIWRNMKPRSRFSYSQCETFILERKSRAS